MADSSPFFIKQAQTLLTLPPELRNLVYDFLISHDMSLFAETLQPPPLLSSSSQLRREYLSAFFGSNLMSLDAYNGGTDSWYGISSTSGRLAVLRKATFVDLTDFWSLAAARRHCQRLAYNREDAGRGILTVRMGDGVKRWQWSAAA